MKEAKKTPAQIIATVTKFGLSALLQSAKMQAYVKSGALGGLAELGEHLSLFFSAFFCLDLKKILS